MGAQDAASPPRRDGDADDGEHHRDGDEDLAVGRDLEAVGVALARPRDEHEEQHEVHDRAGHDVEPDAGHAGRRVDTGLLQEAQVERHPADVGGRDAVDERRRHLRFHVGDERQWLRDATRQADRGGDVRDQRHQDAHDEPRPIGVRQCREAVVDMGELREQHVEGGGERGDHHERPRPHAYEAFERRRLLAGDLGDLRAELAQERLRRVLAGRGREREGLEVRRRRREVVAARDSGPPTRRPVGAHDLGQRHQELGAVDRLQPGRRRFLAEAEVDHDRPPVGDEDVRGTEGTVREPGAVHHDRLRARPRRGASASISVRRQLVEPAPVDVVERERHRTVGQLGERLDGGDRHARFPREQQEEGLMLDVVVERRATGGLRSDCRSITVR